MKLDKIDIKIITEKVLEMNRNLTMNVNKVMKALPTTYWLPQVQKNDISKVF